MDSAVHEAGCMPPYIRHPPAIKTHSGFQEQRVLMLQEVTGFLYSPPFGLFSGPKDSTFENVRFVFFSLNLILKVSILFVIQWEGRIGRIGAAGSRVELQMLIFNVEHKGQVLIGLHEEF